MVFCNIEFDEMILEKNDLFVACLGYEERSFYLYDKFFSRLNKGNSLIFILDNYKSYDISICDKIKDIIESDITCKLIGVQQEDEKIFQQLVVDRVVELMEDRKDVKINIDYSSMPHGWYCKLPEILSVNVRAGDEISFWYSEGNYIELERKNETIGIGESKLYSGRSSLDTKRSRVHLLGVGYDSVRTQGIVSILDPEYCIVCEAYNPKQRKIHENVVNANSSILEQTPVHLTLYITDMEFMIAKLKGIINELYIIGGSDVILVPDGPKPLIFAMSMMPWLIGKEGISCLHISGNNANVKANIKPQGEILGFSIRNEK